MSESLKSVLMTVVICWLSCSSLLHPAHPHDHPNMLCAGTPSGVLNYGNCSVDAAIAISDRLVTLRLEDAEASYASDKDMIDQLISQAKCKV